MQVHPIFATIPLVDLLDSPVTMFDTKPLDDLARRLAEALPPGLTALREELEKNFRAILHAAFAKMDLVTREEFDVQTAVLARTREKLESLHEQVAKLEQQLLNKDS